MDSVTTQRALSAADLGNPQFRQTHGLRYNYLAGAMYKGIASAQMVVALARAGMLGFLGSGGLSLPQLEAALHSIQSQLQAGQAYGVNLLANPHDAQAEMESVELMLRMGVTRVEASAYIQPGLALLRFHVSGLADDGRGGVLRRHHVFAKLSRPEVARAFMQAAAPEMVQQLLQRGWISAEQAQLARRLPVAEVICVEADSGGHTDRGNLSVLFPAIRRLALNIAASHGYSPFMLGAAGGIGSPEAALAAFMLGADFILTGSINQCTREAGTSAAVKDLLQNLEVQDTAYAPAGDMFETGAQVQVVRKGTFFPMRAQKLYELYVRHDSLQQIDGKTLRMLEEKYFKRSLDAVWAETRAYLERRHPARLAEIEQHPKQKMAHIFRWYFIHSTRLALQGEAGQQVDYQIHCGPALGAFNAWRPGLPWQARGVAEIGLQLLQECAALWQERLQLIETQRAHNPLLELA